MGVAVAVGVAMIGFVVYHRSNSAFLAFSSVLLYHLT
jgi:hypothetical protein